MHWFGKMNKTGKIAVFFLGRNVFFCRFGNNNRMKGNILQQLASITLLGGGRVNHSILRESLEFAPRLVAVDGAAGTAVSLDLMPEAVVGDLDSLTPEVRAVFDPACVVETPDQNRTDFDKALQWAVEQGQAPLVLGVGFMGGRLDHELACYNALVRSTAPCVLLGEEDLCFHLADNLKLALPLGARLSLFPMAEVTGNCTGLRWPVDGLTLSPWGRVGTSNEVAEGQLTLSFDRPGMLVILPRAHLGAVIEALLG
ncbi:thiamine pyrophosphokinase [Aliiroseovarius crassostreae]|nr:thiamine pyrophosphokinase [Aliiroseovarius crassostreae]